MWLFLLPVISWGIVSWGQETGSVVCSVVAAVGGYALFWKAILPYKGKYRFYLGTVWFAAVQAVQLWWLISHPYLYIWAVWGFLSLGMGVQFGLLCLCITPKTLERFSSLAAVAGLWAVMEWSRLFLLSGLTWNPVGLALSASTYSLQFASVVGVYGLSFWVIFTNLWVLKGVEQRRLNPLYWGIILLPYLFGWGQLSLYDREGEPLDVVLVQTGFPVEESLGFQSGEEAVAYVTGEWQKILSLLQQHRAAGFLLVQGAEQGGEGV